MARSSLHLKYSRALHAASARARFSLRKSPLLPLLPFRPLAVAKEGVNPGDAAVAGNERAVIKALAIQRDKYKHSVISLEAENRKYKGQVCTGDVCVGGGRGRRSHYSPPCAPLSLREALPYNVSGAHRGRRVGGGGAQCSRECSRERRGYVAQRGVSACCNLPLGLGGGGAM